MASRLTYGTLPVRPRDSACLGCPKCHRTFSCQRSDYFQAPAGLSPRCEDCGVLLKLWRKVVRYVVVSPEQVEQPG